MPRLSKTQKLIQEFKAKFVDTDDSPAAQYIKTFEDYHDDLEDLQNHIILLSALTAMIAKITMENYYNPNTILKP